MRLLTYTKKVVNLLALLSLAGCVATPNLITKREAYPSLYNAETQPRSILVLPALNESADAEAAEYYNVTISAPLTNAGYYAFPIEVVSDVLRQEGIVDTQSIMGLPGSAFKEGFGADAVLFVNITRWDKVYAVFSGGVHVDLQFRLVSTETGEVLWKYSVKEFLDTSGDSSSGALVSLLATAISTMMAREFQVASLANEKAMEALPAGVYNDQYSLDGESQVVDTALKDYDLIGEAE